MNRAFTRRIGAALVAASICGLALIVPELSRRLAAHNERANFERYAFNPIDLAAFDFAGQPVRFADVEHRGERVLDVSWRGETSRIRLSGRVDDRLPGLVKYGAFLKVYEVARIETGELDTHTPTRLVVAARHPPAWGDPDGRPAAARREWVYELLELRRPDDVPPQPLPPVRTEEEGGPRVRGPVVPVSEFELSDAFARWRFNFVALPEYERTWHYAAALGVTPKLQYPRNKFTDDGMRAMDWTWPASGAAILTLVAGLALLGSSFVKRKGRAA